MRPPMYEDHSAWVATEQAKQAAKPSEYPEHDKMAALRPQIQAVTDFLEWFNYREVTIPGANSARYELAIVDEDGDRYASPGIERLLSEHFEIDTDKLEQEKRAMLAVLRKANGVDE